MKNTENKKTAKKTVYKVVCGGFETRKECNTEYQRVVKLVKDAYVYIKDKQYFIMCKEPANKAEAEDIYKILKNAKVNKLSMTEESAEV